MGFYGYLPSYIRYDKTTGHIGKLIYAELTAYSDETGKFTKNLDFLARVFDVSENTISRHLTDLANKGFIIRERGLISLVRNELLQLTVTNNQENRKLNPKIEEFTNKLVMLWNELHNCRIQMSPEYTRKVEQRLKTFSEAQIETALRNRAEFVKDQQWWQENREHLINIDLLIRNDKMLNKWLNTGFETKRYTGLNLKREILKFKEEDHDKNLLD
jgi:DNA-binding MarR family transcriptional regulator